MRSLIFNRLKQILKSKKLQEEYLAYSDIPSLRAQIQSIPEIGSALDTMIFSRAAEIKGARLKDSIKKLREDLSKINKDKIDKSYIYSEEFLLIAELIFSKITQEINEEKRSLLNHAVINSVLLDFKSFRKEILTAQLRDLDIFHLKLLIDIHKTSNNGKSVDKRKLYELRGIKNLSKEYRSLVPHMNYLSSRGLLDRRSDVDVTMDELEPDAELIEYFVLNDLGTDLVSFVQASV